MLKSIKLLVGNQEKNKLTHNEHFQELRIRVLLSLLIVLTCFILLFTYSNPIIVFLTKPIYSLGYKLYFYKVQEAFVSILKSSFIASVIITSPICLFLLLGFVLPALNKKQKFLLFLMLFSVYIFFILGFYFAYKVMIPMSLKFLFSFANGEFSSIISIEFYLDYFLSLFFCTGIGFQLPLVILLLSKIGIIDYKILAKTRKYSIIIILIISAILTPPDIISQIALSIPLYLLFELGVLFVFISSKIKKIKD